MICYLRRIARRIFLRIDLLQLLHCLQSERSGGIVETEHIGGDVHKDAARDGMSLGNLREEFGEHRRKNPREEVDDSAFLADFHDAQPQREHTSKTERDFEGRLGIVERGVHHGGEYFHVAHENQFHQRDNKRDEEECNPDIIKYHTAKVLHFSD